MKGRPKKGKFWIRFYYGECPVCGSDSSYQERVYMSDEVKPLKAEDRIERIPDETTYDNCLL